MNAQLAQLWADIKGWVSTHWVYSFMIATIVVLALIAWAR